MPKDIFSGYYIYPSYFLLFHSKRCIHVTTKMESWVVLQLNSVITNRSGRTKFVVHYNQLFVTTELVCVVNGHLRLNIFVVITKFVITVFVTTEFFSYFVCCNQVFVITKLICVVNSNLGLNILFVITKLTKITEFVKIEFVITEFHKSITIKTV